MQKLLSVGFSSSLRCNIQAKHVWLYFHSALPNSNLKLLLDSEDDLKSMMLSGHPILNITDLAKSAVTFDHQAFQAKTVLLKSNH